MSTPTSTSTFVVLSRASARRDLTRGAREQAYWDEHAAFIDALVADGFILLGGPLADEGGAMLVVRAGDEAAVRARVAPDPWYAHGILALEPVARWEIFIDEREDAVSLATPYGRAVRSSSVWDAHDGGPTASRPLSSS